MDGPTLFIDVALSLLVFLNVVLYFIFYFFLGGGYIFLTSQVWNSEILKYHYKMY